jgi:hypothetical protein
MADTLLDFREVLTDRNKVVADILFKRPDRIGLLLGNAASASIGTEALELRRVFAVVIWISMKTL